MSSSAVRVVVTGANGFVGDRICEVLAQRGARVVAVVRRAGTAPTLSGVTEAVGDFAVPEFAAEVTSGADAVITTVHPMGADRATQHRIGVEGTPVLARAAASAGAGRLIHISTAAVYDRSPGVGDINESSALVDDGPNDYAVTKRDTDLALAGVEGITRILLRPPAILGPGPTSTWNTLRPEAMRREASARHAVAEQTFPWVHLADLAALAADLATGAILDSADGDSGPIPGACTALNVVVPARATQRDYYEAVTGALGVEPAWDSEPSWTGRLLSDRAYGWGWAETVGLPQALDEIVAGL